jgi:hypothetical protein
LDENVARSCSARLAPPGERGGAVQLGSIVSSVMIQKFLMDRRKMVTNF